MHFHPRHLLLVAAVLILIFGWWYTRSGQEFIIESKGHPFGQGGQYVVVIPKGKWYQTGIWITPPIGDNYVMVSDIGYTSDDAYITLDSGKKVLKSKGEVLIRANEREFQKIERASFTDDILFSITSNGKPPINPILVGIPNVSTKFAVELSVKVKEPADVPYVATRLIVNSCLPGTNCGVTYSTPNKSNISK